MNFNFDLDKEEQEFKEELETGKFKMDTLHNNELDYDKEKKDRDLAVFEDFLNSDSFKKLDKISCRGTN